MDKGPKHPYGVRYQTMSTTPFKRCHSAGERYANCMDKIIFYDDEFIGKVERLKGFLDIEAKDYPVLHRFLIDNFGYLFNVFQYYAKHIAESDAQDFEEVDEEIKRELMRPLSYRQYEMIGRSFSIWEEETDLVITSIWDYLYDYGRIYKKKVMSSAEVSGFSLILMNVYRCLARSR